MQNVGIINFAKRRQTEVTQESALGGFTGKASTLLDIIGSYPDDEAKIGFSDFVRVVEIHPEDLKLFLGTFREAKPGETIIVRMETRYESEQPNEREQPVPVQYILGDKEAPEAARVILYSRAQLEKEGFADGLAPWQQWGIVSINMGPVDEPMTPWTMWRNYLFSQNPDDPRGKGGSPHFKDKPNEYFIAEKYRSDVYWANRGRVVKELPEL